MGSIAAILSRESPVGIGDVPRMLEASPHRGSDLTTTALGRCVLGIANVEGETDAWLARAGGRAAAFTGRLDNHAELVSRFGIDRAGRSVTPADVVLEAFDRSRDDAPAALRGFFAGIVTDGSNVWCFRDHMAFAGLHFLQGPHAFYAASEAKQVVAGSGIAFEPDVDVVERMFYADVDDNTPCALKGVDRLSKATVLVSDGARARTRRYWDPARLVETGRYAPAEIPERFDELMERAVTRVLTGDDVVSLSGGVDSPAVAAYAAGHHGQISDDPLGALSMVFPGFPACDEREYIELVAGRLRMQLHTYEPTARPLDDIMDWVRLCDGPIPIHPPAEAAEHYRLARKLGYRTMLGGDLAEYVVDRRYGLLPYLLAQGRFRPAARMIVSQHRWGMRWPGLARQIVLPLIPRSVMVARERLRRSRAGWFPEWLDDRYVNEVNARNELAPQTRWRTEQIAFFIGPAIGTEADDVIQTVCGIRNRRPWIDVDLCEFFVSLPAEVKFPQWFSKSLVRSLLRGKVPDRILDRTDKTVFNDRIMATIDYPALRHWLIAPKYRVKGVNYQLLADRLEREIFHIGDFKWAVDLAKTHAFLSQW
jgi:asparagine synthase (glutamine-hydrolysing)